LQFFSPNWWIAGEIAAEDTELEGPLLTGCMVQIAHFEVLWRLADLARERGDKQQAAILYRRALDNLPADAQNAQKLRWALEQAAHSTEVDNDS
jgi:hypothetical protein